MIFNTILATLSVAASAVAIPNLAARDAPAVTYPRSGVTWSPYYRHNVTWATGSGTGTIAITQNGQSQTLAQNVDLSRGRVEVVVPGNLALGDGYIVTINSNGQTSSSSPFGIGPEANNPVSSAASSASSAVASATSIASSVASSASSVLSSAASSASSAVSSASSAASSLSSSVASVSGSAASSLSSEASSAASSLSSALSSLSSAAQSASNSVSSRASSIASSASSATNSAATSNAAGPAADLGVTRFGVAIAAGLVAVVTFGGALVF